MRFFPDRNYSHHQFHEFLVGWNSDAHQEHQYTESTGSNHTFSPLHPDSRSYVNQLYSFYPCTYMDCDTERFWLTGSGKCPADNNRASDAAACDFWLKPAYGTDGRTLSVVLRYFFSTSTGIERLFRTFSPRTYSAYRTGMYPVLCCLHADYRSRNHVPAKQIYPYFRLWLRQGCNYCRKHD